MLEWLAFPAVLFAAAFIPKKKMSDTKKIEKIFENTGIYFKEGENVQRPKLIEKHKQDDYTTYIYSIPLGLSESRFEAISEALKDGLHKEVSMELEGVLKLTVYDSKLPNKWYHSSDLIRRGTWEVAIGQNHEGVLYHDFDKYPHLLMGGTTRFGKTVSLKGIFHSLLANNPEQVEIYILDLKAGLEFYKYSGLPQVKAVACDVYEAAEVLNEVVEQLKKDEIMFRKNNWTNIVDTPIKKRKFIIVDEGAELSPRMITDKTKRKYAEFCQSALSEISRIGGGIGLRLLYCTQYPTKEAVSMAVKMNIVSRMSFIVPEAIGSKVLLDEYGAEKLPAIPGRAIYKVEKQRIVQVPYIDDKMIFRSVNNEDRENRTIINDHRPIGSSEDQTPTNDS